MTASADSDVVSAQSVNEMKTKLRKYSRLLRRDFLFILVRACKLELHQRTSRTDWRTRTGMFQFLEKNRAFLEASLEKSGFIRWYCNSFEMAERVLSDRKFVQFLHERWPQYSEVLETASLIDVLHRHEAYVEAILKGLPPQNTQPEASLEPIIQIINDYKGTPKEKPLFEDEGDVFSFDFSCQVDIPDFSLDLENPLCDFSIDF